MNQPAVHASCHQQRSLVTKWKVDGCFLEWWYPQIIHFNRVFHYKPSILGYPYSWKHPDSEVNVSGPTIHITQGGFPKKVGIEIFP